MTPEQTQAKSLIDFLGRDKAIAHVEFVLSKKLGLEKESSLRYWHSVLYLIKQQEQK